MKKNFILAALLLATLAFTFGLGARLDASAAPRTEHVTPTEEQVTGVVLPAQPSSKSSRWPVAPTPMAH